MKTYKAIISLGSIDLSIGGIPMIQTMLEKRLKDFLVRFNFHRGCNILTVFVKTDNIDSLVEILSQDYPWLANHFIIQ